MVFAKRTLELGDHYNILYTYEEILCQIPRRRITVLPKLAKIFYCLYFEGNNLYLNSDATCTQTGDRINM